MYRYSIDTVPIQYCTVYTVLYIHYCIYVTVYTVLYIQNCKYSTVYTVLYIQYCIYSTVYTVLYIQYCIYSSVCTVLYINPWTGRKYLKIVRPPRRRLSNCLCCLRFRACVFLFKKNCTLIYLLLIRTVYNKPTARQLPKSF